jgi:hypothetical protein
LEDVVLSDLPPGIPPADAVLAVDCYGKLIEHYPGHRWRVTADHRGGCVFIQLLYAGIERKEWEWGWVIHINRLDPNLKAIVKAGGELLERYRLSRGPAPEDAALRALENGLEIGR